MDAVLSLVGLPALVVACAAALFAGLVKGMVGFAMPMLMISGMAILLPPDIALAGLILPTLVTNGMQALRQGPRAAWATIRAFRVFLIVGLVALVGSAQLVTVLSPATLYLVIGLGMTAFAAMQIVGWSPRMPTPVWPLEAAVGAVAGFSGGLSGVWGPPTVAYLTARDTPKRDAVRVQGVIYGLGAVALLAAHLRSGVMRAETLPFSAALVVPALIGMVIGQRVQDRIDQAAFRRLTLVVLCVAGANLIRRGLVG